MREMIVVFVSLLAFSTWADDVPASTEPPILSLERTLPATEDGTQSNVLIEISANGSVLKTITKYPAGSASSEVSFVRGSDLKSSALHLNECAEEIFKADLAPPADGTPVCEDKLEIHYKGKFSAKDFAVRACGQLRMVDVACAQEMVTLLDSLEADDSRLAPSP